MLVRANEKWVGMTPIAEGGSADIALGFESTVPKRLVHRHSIAEVFVTECLSMSEADRFVLGAQWPRIHPFYNATAGRYDTMLLAETLRQSAIYLAHTRYRVSLSDRFVMQRIRIHSDLERLVIGDSAAGVQIDAVVSDVLRKGGKLSKYSVNLKFSIAGKVVGTGLGVAQILSQPLYEKLRWKDRNPEGVENARCNVPVAPASVGRTKADDVVLSPHPRPNCWELRTDENHPILFDHPSDHVPGMSVLEAFRQGALAASNLGEAWVSELDVTFERFAEIDERAFVVVATAEIGCEGFDAVLEQAGASVAKGRVVLARPSPDGGFGPTSMRRIGDHASSTDFSDLSTAG